MMTVEQLRKLPRHLVERLHNTAQALGHEDFQKERAIEQELAGPQALLIDPTLLEQRDAIRAVTDRHGEWIGRLQDALREPRNALVVVGRDDFLDEP